MFSTTFFLIFWDIFALIKKYLILILFLRKINMNKNKRNPTDFLKQIMGRLVSVKLHNGNEYVGVLATFDGLMNVVLQ